MWHLLTKDGQSLQYVTLTLAWNYLLGYNPVKLPPSFIKLISLVRTNIFHPCGYLSVTLVCIRHFQCPAYHSAVAWPSSTISRFIHHPQRLGIFPCFRCMLDLWNEEANGSWFLNLGWIGTVVLPRTTSSACSISSSGPVDIL